MRGCNLATGGIHWQRIWERVKTGKQQFLSSQMIVGVEAISPCIFKNGKHMMQDAARCREFSMLVLWLMLHCDAAHCTALFP